MAEFINPTTQTVEVNANVLFTETVVSPCPKVRHRKGSGVFTFKGGRYIVTFYANIAVPAGETPEAVALAISINGEAVQGGIMRGAPIATDSFFNVSNAVEIDVPCNCCYNVSVKNISEIPLTVDNANLITIREVQ